MARVELQDIKKQYENGYVAVHGANFTIEDGEFMVLVGPSGCGKSTTLRMIAGLETISSGTLRIGNTVVNDIAPKDRDIAMVFQNYALYPHMTVYDNMAFGLKLRKFDKAEIHERVQNAAKILGIESMLDRKPKELSGGQRQRVAVGRAIVRKPKVFLFDEPLSNLDAKLRVQMRAEISKLHRQLGTTMVYVTHDQVEAMTMGNRIVVMKDGHIMQLDTPLNLYNQPANKFVAGFIGSPAMNFISGTIERQNGLVFRSEKEALHLPVGRTHETALSGYIGKAVTLGIRPEDIYVQNRILTENETALAGEMILEVEEPMGNETFIYAGCVDGTIVARIDPQELPDVGAAIHLVFDLTKQHFFDNATELAIR
ncbi:MAG: sn-glycerol-3-phosphate ABC transporter ATP-binding protein UgpC [Bacteroidetes Order II. Incertae sedis bacterium]|nr:sn-glycerol-3-phosphate ABC transporter ATP-binding protein UgpC [Bacteroidetes Order II. bacterium]